MTTKPATMSEDEYFAVQEAEARRKLALTSQRELEVTERERLQALHHMRCPKCGMALETVTFREVQIDRCYACNGSWLDPGELEQLAAKEPGFLGKLVSVFQDR